MPSKILKKLAKRTGKSLADLERYWKEAKKIAKEKGLSEDDNKFWRYVMGITTRRAGYHKEHAAKKDEAILKRVKAKKYLGDDEYSWAIFVDGESKVTGLSKDEIEYYKKMIIGQLKARDLGISKSAMKRAVECRLETAIHITNRSEQPLNIRILNAARKVASMRSLMEFELDNGDAILMGPTDADIITSFMKKGSKEEIDAFEELAQKTKEDYFKAMRILRMFEKGID